MGSIILNVVIVLGIIIAGGFLIFFLGDLLISIVDPKGEEERIKNKKKESAKKFAKKVEKLPEEEKEEVKSDPQVVALLASAEEEKPAEEVKPAENAVVEEYVPEQAAEEPAEPTEEDKLAEAHAALEKRKAEILARIKEQYDEEDEDEEEAEEAEEEETAEEAVEETAEEPEPVETAEQAALRKELEEARAALTEERAKTSELLAKLQNNEPIKPVKTRDEYLRDLDELEARLRENEKEFKACKKEYLPLARVNRTLEKDEKKLRIKEAIVAKQKVLLYGVNNYEDIDEEKAKKLAEDLDLLDGLKLSVQHCHEVMDNNKERFPVLEKMYTILKTQNEQLRADILEIQEALKNIQD